MGVNKTVLIIEEIMVLLKECDESETVNSWIKWLNEKAKKLRQTPTDKDKKYILLEIDKYLAGGMGSMVDLAIYPKKKSENERIAMNKKYINLINQLGEIIELELKQ